MVGNVRQGWVLFAAMWILLVAGLALTVPGERTATPAMQAAGVSATAPEPRGQGGPDRHRTSRRCGRSRPPTPRTAASTRCTTPTSRSAGSRRCSTSAIGEVDLRRGRQRPVRDDLLRRDRRVHRRADGRAAPPSTSGKKIGARQVKIVVIAILVPFLVALAFTALAVVLAGRARGPAEHRAPRVQRDLLRVPVAGEQQRLGVRGPHREHALLHDHRRHRDARRPVRAADRGARARRERRAGSAPCRSRRGRCGPTRGCSPGC